MAQNTGYSERQIHRIKDDLVRAGHLRVIERRRADGGNNGNNGTTGTPPVLTISASYCGP